MTTTAMISYAQSDGGESFREQVLALSNRLCEDGVDCMLDQYTEGRPPAEGWQNWMLTQIQTRDYTLVVCTRALRRRWEGNEEANTGLGATYEGTIVTLDIYNAGMKNERFIPIGFKPLSQNRDGTPIPLQPTTYYDVSTDAGYQSLLKRLLGDPGIIQPPVGKPKVFDDSVSTNQKDLVARDSENWLFLQMLFCRYTLVEVQNDKTILVKLSVNDPQEIASLNELQFPGLPKDHAISFAYANYGTAVTVKSIVSRSSGKQTEFELLLVPAKTHDSNFEPSTTTDVGSFSADAIAELRAKLILLGERIPQDDPRFGALPMLVRGINTSVDVQDPIIPAIRENFSDDDAFLRCARLAAIYVLCASGTVDSVELLELGPVADGRVKVKLVGMRAARYSNSGPYRVVVDGFCES